MYNKEMMEQMIDFHKTNLENSFSMMVMIQNQAEKYFSTLIDKNPGISDEGKKIINQWNDACKKSTEKLKITASENFDKMASFFNNNLVTMFQEQAEKFFSIHLSESCWMPEILRKMLGELYVMYKKNCDEINKCFGENIRHMADLLPVAANSQTKTKQQK